MKKIRFAVIGAGHIGKRHAEMVIRHPEAELVAMCDIRTKAECGIGYDIPFYGTAEDMITNGPACDVVCICSPNGLHASHAMLALEKLNHVVIEKPMALSNSDCEKIIFRALNVHRQVFCVMQNRYSPPSVWIKKIIDDHLLGSVFMVNINCYWNRDKLYYDLSNWKGKIESDGGTLFTQFSHFVDMMYWLFGDIQNIQARFRNFNHHENTEFEDSGIVSFDFVSGGIGTLNFSTAAYHTNFESSMTIIGEHGTVKLGGQYMNKVEHCLIANYDMPELPATLPANDYGNYKGSAANHGFIIENVVDTLMGRSNITTNAIEGLKVVDIIERIYRAAPRDFKHITR